jgi:hypothetical protein
VEQDKIERETELAALKVKGRERKQQMIDALLLRRQAGPLNRIGENSYEQEEIPTIPLEDNDRLDPYVTDRPKRKIRIKKSKTKNLDELESLYQTLEEEPTLTKQFDFDKKVMGANFEQINDGIYGYTAKNSLRRGPTKDQIAHRLEGLEALKTMKGSGLNKKKKGKGVIYGRGSSIKSQQNRHYLGMYYLEKKKLNENILSVKYSKTDSPIQKLRSQKISNELKEIINDVITNKFNKRLYDGLNETDKRLFNRLIDTVKLTDSIPIDNSLDDNFQKNYQVLLGEFQSGNNSPEIKDALKRYVVEGLGMGIINKNESLFLLYQLSL